ncbi:hypothetical protein D3C76_1646860 [compost metagenome]
MPVGSVFSVSLLMKKLASRYSFHTPRKLTMNTVTSTGKLIGNTILANNPRELNPSMIPASSNSSGTDFMKAEMSSTLMGMAPAV